MSQEEDKKYAKKIIENGEINSICVVDRNREKSTAYIYVDIHHKYEIMTCVQLIQYISENYSAIDEAGGVYSICDDTLYYCNQEHGRSVTKKVPSVIHTAASIKIRINNTIV